MDYLIEKNNGIWNISYQTNMFNIKIKIPSRLLNEWFVKEYRSNTEPPSPLKGIM